MVHAAGRTGDAWRTYPRQAFKSVPKGNWRRYFPVFSPASAYDYPYDIELKSGAEPVCAAYVRVLLDSSFPQIARCERPDVGDVDGFQRISRQPLQPKEVSGLLVPVVKLLAKDEYRAAKIVGPDTDADHFERRQQRSIEAGQPHRLFYRFDPQPDIDNDGTPEDVAIWKDIGVPCGFVKVHDPMFSPTQLLILDSHGNLDEGRTREVFGLDSIAPTTSNSRKWLGDSFGVLRFRGEFYFDTFNSYSNLDHPLSAAENHSSRHSAYSSAKVARHGWCARSVSSSCVVPLRTNPLPYLLTFTSSGTHGGCHAEVVIMSTRTAERRPLGALGRMGVVAALHVGLLYMIANSMGMVPTFKDPETETFVVEEARPVDDPEPQPEPDLSPRRDTLVLPDEPPPLQFEQETVLTEVPPEIVERWVPPGGTAEVQPVIVRARPDSRYPLSQPPYPPADVRAGNTGTAEIEVYVLPNGRVGDARIIKSTGYESLDRSALEEAKRKWRLAPATRDGEPFAQWHRLLVTFKLNPQR